MVRIHTTVDSGKVVTPVCKYILCSLSTLCCKNVQCFRLIMAYAIVFAILSAEHSLSYLIPMCFSLIVKKRICHSVQYFCAYTLLAKLEHLNGKKANRKRGLRDESRRVFFLAAAICFFLSMKDYSISRV